MGGEVCECVGGGVGGEAWKGEKQRALGTHTHIDTVPFARTSELWMRTDRFSCTAVSARATARPKSSSSRKAAR